MTDALSFSSLNADHEIIDFAVFHQETVQTLIAERNHLIQSDLTGVPPLSLVSTNGEAYTYRFEGGRLVVDPDGDAVAAHTIVELAPEDFSDFFREILTVSGLVAAQRINVSKGDISGFRRWEPALRAIYCGRPIYSMAVKDQLLDQQAKPIDLTQCFSMEDLKNNQADMQHFLKTVGYIHIVGVFNEDEINKMRSEIDGAMQLSKADDGKSWWSTLANGDEVPTRINYLNRFSDFFDDLAHDSRVQKIGKLLDPHHLVCLDRVDGPMVFIKSSKVVTGLANLLWHKDCDLGGHPIMCPIMQLGIQLDPANAENGQVLMLAGSHKYSNHLLEAGNEGELPVVPLVTRPGDVTLHYGDTLHTTPAPTGDHAGRRVLYYKFEKPEMFDVIPAGAHYNDILFSKDSSGRVASRAKTWKSKKQLDGI